MSSESSPDPKKSGRFRRMTRRTSSMLSFGSGGRSGTPGAQSSHHKNESSSASEASDSRRTSIDRQSIDIPPAPPTATDTPSTSSSLSVVTTVPDHISKEHTMPSAIPESPMREAAANEEEALLHGKARVPKSSLSQVVTAAQSPPQDKAPAPAPAPDAPEQRQELPPPVIVTEPSKFTTEPDQMSTHSPVQPSASAKSSLPVIQTTSDPAPQPPSQPSEPSARPAESHGSTDILEPLPPAQPRTTSDSYFDPRDIPVESFHAQSDPHNIKRLKEEINKNTIGESPSSSEGQTNERNEDKQLREATSPEDIVTPRPHGPGDMENVNVYISGPTAVQPKPAQPVPAAPVQPAQPKPVQPAGPVQLAQPKPVQPAAPVQPAQSVKPVQPAVPVQPAQSVKPVQPAVPVQPASAGPAPTMPVPMTASPAAPVEVPATAVVTTELKRTIEGSVKIPEAVVLPSPDTHVQPTGPESGIREIVQTDIKKQDDVASASENEDPFADPVVPIQISAQPSSEPDHGQEEIPMPQPQPISPQSQPQPHTASVLSQPPHQMVYMPLPPLQEVSGGKHAPRGYEHDDTRPLLPNQAGQAPQGYKHGVYGHTDGYGATTSHEGGQHHPHHPHQSNPSSYLPQHFYQATIPSYAYTQGYEVPGSHSSSDITHVNNANPNTVAFPKLKSPLPSSHPSSRTRVSSHSHSSAIPRLHHLGWQSYSLPNPENTVYYVHPQMRITTDVDLGSLKVLDDVMRYLDMRRVGNGDDATGRHGTAGNDDVVTDVGVPKGYELWLMENPAQQQGRAWETSHNDNGKKNKQKKRGARSEFSPLRCWVDHKKRLATFDPIWDARVDGVGVGAGRGRGEGRPKRTDDVLDMEYRYWSFLESHPAHTGLPPKAHSDAADVLAWALTDRLVPPNLYQHGISMRPPFTPEESQELHNMLRSFGENPDETGIQSIVHTRLVARIFMRVLHWRQINFRSHKPLPDDVPKSAYLNYLTHQNQARHQAPSFFRALLDVLVSILFLGIPFMLYSRAIQAQRLDAEYGMSGFGMRAVGMRDAGPLLLIGACTCLVAAIVLSASVTFLSLPGLDSISRVVGFVAIILAGFSMMSTVLALFSYKNEMDRTSLSYLGGGEGLMVHSRRIIILSLPLAFCIYSIVAFVVGIALYSFRGSQIAIPAGTLERHFSGYTQWSVLGVLGGLGGVIAVTAVCLLG